VTNHREEFPEWVSMNKARIALTFVVVMAVTILIMLAMRGYQHHGNELARIQRELNTHADEIVEHQQEIIANQRAILEALKASKH